MKPTPIHIHEVAEWSNLALAAHRAGRRKRHRPTVAAFFRDFDHCLARLGETIRAGAAPSGRYTAFRIHDPKPRLIQAACFEDRVLHHAVINLAGPVLERSLCDASFACRPGRGVHRAAARVQELLRRRPWYVKIDVRAYFDSIDHDLLLGLLARRFKGRAFLDLLERLVRIHPAGPGRGLPIGSLTSQHFANFFLDGMDRHIQAQPGVRGLVRYMDDLLWFCDDRATARDSLAVAIAFARDSRLLHIKESAQINHGSHGVSYCGFRILPGAIRLGARRRRRYQERRLFWERAFMRDLIDARQLQNWYSAVHAITHGADAGGWRQQNLHLHPPVEA
jgi:hypothetical protein